MNADPLTILWFRPSSNLSLVVLGWTKNTLDRQNTYLEIRLNFICEINPQGVVSVDGNW